MGTYISRKRVERDGRLVAFKGEAMTEVEAENRGLSSKDGVVAKIEKAEAADEALEAEKVEAVEAVIATAVPGGKRPGRKPSKPRT
ncbi:MAG TPA: hypothetical protein VIK83_02885 [Coriobacteriia bacterium]